MRGLDSRAIFSAFVSDHFGGSTANPRPYMSGIGSSMAPQRSQGIDEWRGEVSDDGDDGGKLGHASLKTPWRMESRLNECLW